MDTSKEYIEMCEASQEIQALKNLESGSVYYDKQSTGNDKVEFLDYSYLLDRCTVEEVDAHTKRVVWLPRQDQLQKMRLGHDLNRTPIALISVLMCYKAQEELRWKEDQLNFKMKFKTMEQIWLSIIMEELYWKEWNFDLKVWECKTDNQVQMKIPVEISTTYVKEHSNLISSTECLSSDDYDDHRNKSQQAVVLGGKFEQVADFGDCFISENSTHYLVSNCGIIELYEKK